MHRWTARFLLLLLLAGTFAPAAPAMAVPPSHAACPRQSMPMRHCHEGMAPQPSESALRAAGCCENHDCCRSLGTARWAQPQPRVMARALDQPGALLSEPHPLYGVTDLISSRSVRAPPLMSSC